MNKKFTELIESCRVKDKGYFIYQYGGMSGHLSVERAIDLDKLINLVVEECCNQVRAIDEMEIKKHFDVKI